MKRLNYVFMLLLLTFLCCNNEDPQTQPAKDDSAVSSIDLNAKGKDGQARISNNLGFIYKKSIWLKPNAAIHISAASGKAVIFNPNRWTTFEIKGNLSAYNTNSWSDTGCDCGSNEVCINGICTPVNPCNNCPSGTTCINGLCVSNNPCGGGCPDGQTCVNGVCQLDNPCASCASNETCINGMCMPTEPCGGECDEGETCINGVCQPDPCNDCDEDEICINGECRSSAGPGGDIGQVQTSAVN